MNRRTFLKLVTDALGGLMTLLLAIPGVSYLIAPLNQAASTSGFRRVGRLQELEPNVPKQMALRDTRQDAWTLYSDDVVGRVWLIRRAGDQVDAFTAVCPHLGCSINFDDSTQRFLCPCHDGVFHLSGERVDGAELGATNPVPRGMDRLEVRQVEIPGDDGDFFLEIQYQTFVQGLPQSQPKG